jgi:hypothetical protein
MSIKSKSAKLIGGAKAIEQGVVGAGKKVGSTVRDLGEAPKAIGPMVKKAIRKADIVTDAAIGLPYRIVKKNVKIITAPGRWVGRKFLEGGKKRIAAIKAAARSTSKFARRAK